MVKFLDGVKIHQVGLSETEKCIGSNSWHLQFNFLCISIIETLLHLTLKRRAEISADIFARLWRYFSSSCVNLTITVFIYRVVSDDLEISLIHSIRYEKEMPNFHSQLALLLNMNTGHIFSN